MNNIIQITCISSFLRHVCASSKKLHCCNHYHNLMVHLGLVDCRLCRWRDVFSIRITTDSYHHPSPPLLVLAFQIQNILEKYLKWIGYLVNLPHFQTFPIEEVPDTISSIISSEERWRDCVWNSNLPHKTIDWPLRWWCVHSTMDLFPDSAAFTE